MAINVTPIPKLAGFAAPAFTLGTANAAGDARTTIASNSTLLAFDVTAPAAVGVAAVGTAVTAPRRDHSHAGVTGAGTVVDDAITRFNGTGGSALQGYTSLSPTVSDDGVITLTSGALKFPASAIASSNENTLDDYERGVYQPSVTFGGNSVDVAYAATRYGYYTKIGNQVSIWGRVELTNKGSSTGQLKITGLPFDPANGAPISAGGYLSQLTFSGPITILVAAGGTSLDFYETASNAGATTMTQADVNNTAVIGWTGTYSI
tara:strand:+ start:710 stop:1498 length:789 start_codon:yes stop_codon:yes gene_type:complete